MAFVASAIVDIGQLNKFGDVIEKVIGIWIDFLIK